MVGGTSLLSLVISSQDSENGCIEYNLINSKKEKQLRIFSTHIFPPINIKIGVKSENLNFLRSTKMTCSSDKNIICFTIECVRFLPGSLNKDKKVQSFPLRDKQTLGLPFL